MSASLPEIQRVWRKNHEVYGAKKAWKQLNREQIVVARCTVARLMKQIGLRGAVRGARCRTTIPEPVSAQAPDLVQRNFTVDGPNILWIADLTYVATWRGFVYTAFVVDALPDASWAGACQPRSAAISRSMPWSRPCMTARRMRD